MIFSPALQRGRMTFHEYVAFEMRAETKHEFHDGIVVEVPACTFAHCRINSNVIAAAGRRLVDSQCFMLDSAMRMAIARRVRHVYADSTIICGQPKFDPGDSSRTAIENPRVIIEVLSPSTERYDRGAKFNFYRDLESLREYVLVSQDEAMIEIFLRPEEDVSTWQFSVAKGLESVAKFQSVNIDVPLSEIYAGITFPPPEELPQVGLPMP